MLQKFIDIALGFPGVFELQQNIFNNYRAVRQHFIKYVDTRGRNILDVGCSTGAAGRQIIDFESNLYIGLDLSPRYVRLASRRNPKACFLAMDARCMGLRDRIIDIVLFNGVIHHLDDQTVTNCLAEVSRVLATDGVVLVAEPIFTPQWPVSSWFLRHDRGRFIRSAEGYRELFRNLRIVNEGRFRFSFHHFISFVMVRR